MTFSVSTATWCERAAAAESALHLLEMGGAGVVASIKVGEKEVKYATANINDLRRYFQRCKSKCNGCSPGFLNMTQSDC